MRLPGNAGEGREKLRRRPTRWDKQTPEYDLTSYIAVGSAVCTVIGGGSCAAAVHICAVVRAGPVCTGAVAAAVGICAVVRAGSVYTGAVAGAAGICAVVRAGAVVSTVNTCTAVAAIARDVIGNIIDTVNHVVHYIAEAVPQGRIVALGCAALTDPVSHIRFIVVIGIVAAGSASAALTCRTGFLSAVSGHIVRAAVVFVIVGTRRCHTHAGKHQPQSQKLSGSGKFLSFFHNYRHAFP